MRANRNDYKIGVTHIVRMLLSRHQNPYTPERFARHP
jgi:hypothetical protein